MPALFQLEHLVIYDCFWIIEVGLLVIVIGIGP